LDGGSEVSGGEAEESARADARAAEAGSEPLMACEAGNWPGYKSAFTLVEVFGGSYMLLGV